MGAEKREREREETKPKRQTRLFVLLEERRYLVKSLRSFAAQVLIVREGDNTGRKRHGTKKKREGGGEWWRNERDDASMTKGGEILK
jgi:hypothetical protein